MKRLGTTLWNDESGQDLIEYALMAGFCAISIGAIFPPAITAITQNIFSKVMSQLTVANA